MIGRTDIRVILGLLCAVAIAYWLLLPGPPKTVPETSPPLDEAAPKRLSSELNDGDGLAKEKMVSLKENLGASLVRLKDLEKTLAEKDAEVEKLQKVIADVEKNTKPGNDIQMKNAKLNKLDQTTSFTGHRLVHLDFKGAAPKMSYLEELLPFVKSQGATGLLVEYEDSYPFDGELSLLRSPDAYTKEEIVKFIKMAKELDLTVIPLVQTFGHLEYVLKHKQFAHLRETEKVKNSLCPLKNGSLELVKSLVKDILRLHPDSSWIHLGGDEVWNLKSCKKCIASSKSKADLYLQHMMPLFKFLKEETNEKVMPIIWDDMMRSWNVDDLKAIAKFVQPMVWAYVPSLEDYYKFPEGMWKRFHQAFPKIWIASSFKGASKPGTNYVPIKNHIDNHLSWMRIISTFPKSCKVLGMALTGWSRFDHYGPLCELLPAGVPSLVFCLTVLRMGHFDKDVQLEVSKKLGFAKNLPTVIQNFKSYKIHNGKFPGHEVFGVLNKYEKANGWFMSGKVREDAWAREYQIKHNHVSYYQLNVTSNAAGVSIDMLQKLKPKAMTELSKIFSKTIVKEWIEDKILATAQEAMTMKQKIDKIIKELKVE